MNRKYNDRYVTSIPFEASVFFRFRQLLPNGITLSDELNDFLKRRLLELEKDKDEAVPNCAPVKVHENTNEVTSVVSDPIKPTLNIYDSKDQLINCINSIEDKNTAFLITRQAKFLAGLAETRAKKLQLII